MPPLAGHPAGMSGDAFIEGGEQRKPECRCQARVYFGINATKIAGYGSRPCHTPGEDWAAAVGLRIALRGGGRAEVYQRQVGERNLSAKGH